MNYFVIKAKGASIFWTGTQWHHRPAKRYASKKTAENAVKNAADGASGYEFNRREKEVVEIKLP